MKEIITPLGRLVLFPDTAVDISKNNPLFTRAEEFSINLTVPRKPNEHIFGYKYRLASTGAVVPIEAQFRFFSREKLSGTIELVSGDDDNYEVLLKGSRNTFLFQYGKTLLSALEFAWENFGAGMLPAQVQAEMLASIGGSRDWICFPVYNSDQNLWINRWSFDENTFAWDPAQHRTVFMRIDRLLVRMFALKGYTVTENWFSATTERQRIVIFNDRSDVGGTINIRNLLPDWSVIDFINELEDFFPITIFINSLAKTVKIYGDDNVITDASSGSLDNYVEHNYKILFNEKQSGYDLSVTRPDADKSTDNEWDYTDQSYSGEVDTYADLPDNAGEGEEYLVVNEGRYYRSKLTDSFLSWESIGSKALGVREGKGETKRSTKIYPLLSKTVGQKETVTVTQQYVGTRRVEVNFSLLVPHIAKAPWTFWTKDFRPMVFRGLETAIADPADIPSGYHLIWTNYPMANYLNRRIDGSRWGGQLLELIYGGAQGLRGVETIAFLNDAEKINATLLINHVELEKIDLTKVFTLNGRKLIISEMAIHYQTQQNVLVDAVLLAKAN